MAKKASKSQIVTLTCRHCQRRYNARWDPSKPEKNSRCCGRSPCFELEHWTVKDWEARRLLANRQLSTPVEQVQYEWFDPKREVTSRVDFVNDPVGPVGFASLRA